MVTIALTQQIAALFLMMAAGFILVKTGVAKAEDSKPISTVIVYLIVPAVLIHSFQIEHTPEIRNGFLLSLFTAILIQGLLLLIVTLLKKPLKLTPVEMTSVIYSNAGNLVIPLITAVLGDEWVIYASTYMSFQMILLWTHGNAVLMGKGEHVNWKKILLNPNVIAIAIGIFLFVTQIKLPVVINSVLSSTSACVGPVSMVMLGMLLASVDYKKVFTNSRIYLTVALKMLILPGLMLLILKFSPLKNFSPDGTTILLITLLATITPSATTVTQLAQLHDNEPAYASAINMATTVVALASMPLMIFLYTI
ncbi:MAG: AEC family transporter [Firmicutes bacterium]|nr:AEC family transporter [Bacillota bacterium]